MTGDEQLTPGTYSIHPQSCVFNSFQTAADVLIPEAQ